MVTMDRADVATSTQLRYYGVWTIACRKARQVTC